MQPFKPFHGGTHKLLTPTTITAYSPEVLSQAIPRTATRACGVLTTAFGLPRFIDMAKALAASLELHSPGISRALVTDSNDPELRRWFDILVPYRPELGKPFIQKLHLDEYSPFEHTLYIDSDSLVTRPIEDFWDLCSSQPFCAFGEARLHIDDGVDWYMNTREVLSRYGLTEIPRFNGGLYSFDRSATSQRIFQRVREMAIDWQTKGFYPMANGGPDDEPMFAIAMALEGLTGIDDQCRTMRTLIRLSGRLRLNVLNKTCSFRKEDRQISPAIVHFAGGSQNDYRYRREMYRLRLAFHQSFMQRRCARWLPQFLYCPLSIRNRVGTLLRRHRS